jgi:hypothetical protein
MDVNDFLKNLGELIFLLPVIIFIFGRMLVSLLRRRRRGRDAANAGAAPGQTPGPRRPRPLTLDRLRQWHRPLEATRSPVGTRLPVGVRITREQVFHRTAGTETTPAAAGMEIWTPPAAEPESERLSEVLQRPQQPQMDQMKHSLDERAQLKESKAETPELSQAKISRGRIDDLSPLKRAILWAEILGKPRGW